MFAIFIPGTGTNLSNVGRFDTAVTHFFTDGTRDLGAGRFATVTWLGYGPPTGIMSAMGDDAGRAGGSSLAADLRFGSTFSKHDQTVSLVTHSYGSVVAGQAIANFARVLTMW